MQDCINNQDKCSLLEVAFLSYQAGASKNDSNTIKKSYQLICSNHTDYIQKKITIEELQQQYDNYINGNQNIDHLVDDVFIEFNSELQEIKSSYIEEQNVTPNIQVTPIAQNSKLEQEDQNIQHKKEEEKKKNKQKIIIREIENLSQFQQNEMQKDAEKQDYNLHNNMIDSHTLNTLNLVNVPKMEEICKLSIEQSKQIQQEQYNEFRKQEQSKSLFFQQNSQRSQILQKTKCTICLEIIQSNQYILTACQHIYHKQCLNDLIEAKVDLPIQCPNLECRQEILRDDLEQITTKQTMERLDKFAFAQYLISHPNIFQCPTQGCQGIYEIEGPIQVCMICQQIFCTRCKRQFHDGICGEQSFVGLAREQNYNKCSRCNRWIEKMYGCNHISCPCGHEFCYACGKQWIKGMECRCIDIQQTQLLETQQQIQRQSIQQQQPVQQQQLGQQQQHVQQQQRRQNNQTNQQNYTRYALQARNLYETLQIYFKVDQDQIQNAQNYEFLKDYGLTFLRRFQRK